MTTRDSTITFDPNIGSAQRWGLMVVNRTTIKPFTFTSHKKTSIISILVRTGTPQLSPSSSSTTNKPQFIIDKGIQDLSLRDGHLHPVFLQPLLSPPPHLEPRNPIHTSNPDHSDKPDDTPVAVGNPGKQWISALAS